jgi:hypothetical protein
MMPTSVAIVSSVFPLARRGMAMGVLAGGSAAFAALGPVLGGLLTALDWRLVFVLNLGLAVIVTLLTLSATPGLRADPAASRHVDVPGVIVFALALGTLVYGLGGGAVEGWGSATVIGPIACGLVLLGVFWMIEVRAAEPLIDLRLFRHLNFLAANISQVVAGMVELGLGYLLAIPPAPRHRHRRHRRRNRAGEGVHPGGRAGWPEARGGRGARLAGDPGVAAGPHRRAYQRLRGRVLRLERTRAVGCDRHVPARAADGAGLCGTRVRPALALGARERRRDSGRHARVRLGERSRGNSTRLTSVAGVRLRRRVFTRS